MGATTHRAPAAPPMSDLERAECCLLNADLCAKRRVARGDLDPGEYEALRRHVDAALAHVRLLAVAAGARSLRELAAGGPTP